MHVDDAEKDVLPGVERSLLLKSRRKSTLQSVSFSEHVEVMEVPGRRLLTGYAEQSPPSACWHGISTLFTALFSVDDNEACDDQRQFEREIALMF